MASRRRCTTAWISTLNGRFGQGGQFSGGLSVGRTVTDNCLPERQSVADDRGVSQRCGVAGDVDGSEKLGVLQRRAAVVFRHAGEVPGRLPAAVGLRDERDLPEQPGRPDHGKLRDHQCAGQRTRSAATWRRARARPATCNATVRTELIPPNTMFEPRLTQVDMRVSRLFRLPGTTRLRGTLDIYNIFNASSVLSMTPTYGAAWLNAAQVLSARLLRVGAQLDF